MTKDDGCALCGAISGELVDSAEVAVLQPLVTRAPVHLLVVPVRQFGSVTDMLATAPELMQALAAEALRRIRALRLDESGFRLVMNSGPDTDQTIGHPHLHVIGGMHLTPHP
ncbi:HIT domain-containing protein [Gryllotalpicola reticulitermitis]|uniref:HIT domain-containing protein n=1 Tax=Gryllotalpicola reticulitermitis TaxID=1184153 RepID=A0ABV8Q3C0_9MICO